MGSFGDARPSADTRLNATEGRTGTVARLRRRVLVSGVDQDLEGAG